MSSSNLGDGIKKNPKRFWGYVKTLKSSRNTPREMMYNNESLSDCFSIATAFNQFFKSVFKPLNYIKNIFSSLSIIYEVPAFSIPLIEADEMKKRILQLNPHTSSGYDKLSVTFLINCADNLSIPLSMLFNMCVTMGEYPDLLKKCNITPMVTEEFQSSQLLVNYFNVL